MPVSTKANIWAAKLIIVFQLTVWSIVGIILLQRGVISLCGETKTRNGTADLQETFASRNEKESIQDSIVAETSHRILQHEIATRRRNITLDNLKDATQNGHWLRGRTYTFYPTENVGKRIPKESSSIRKRTTIGRKQDTRANRIQTIRAANKSEEEEVRRKENVLAIFSSNENSYDRRKALRFKPFKSRNSGTTDIVSVDDGDFFEYKDGDIPSNKTTENVKSETKLRQSSVHRIGAAIAIIMLAIGVVMLLLGPLIVILRVFGDRRRTRQMLKLRCDNDQPPTYEEAILMDQVPRYSTLQLDTIFESSSSL